MEDMLFPLVKTISALNFEAQLPEGFVSIDFYVQIKKLLAGYYPIITNVGTENPLVRHRNSGSKVI